MRFPLALTVKIARHIVKHKLARTPKFAMVLQLEPLHTCNLTCTGCGRIREYSTSLKDMVPLERCLEAAADCDAPMVSVCGGEPLIYPHIEDLVAGLRAQGRIIYICTNGMFMRKKMREYMAARFGPAMSPRLDRLVKEGLVTEKEAAQIRSGAGTAGAVKTVIEPSRWMYWNVHVDGLEYTHDLIVEREGVFKECVAAIRMAKILGYQVATNTTVYRETQTAELETMFRYLSSLGCDGHTISPGYDYDAAKKDMVKRLGRDPEEFFLTRALTREKFKDIEQWGQLFTIFGTPVYQEFLAGKRDLTCTAWAVPTFNVRGWKAPCYLMTDGHHASYGEMLQQVTWEKYGVVNGVARDPRCENCMVHCGYDPSGALSSSPRDTWLNLKYNFFPRPAPVAWSAELEQHAHNGASVGKGHLAEAKAVLNAAPARKSAFARNGNDLPQPAQSGCSSGNGNGNGNGSAHGHEPAHGQSQTLSARDELLARIRNNGH